MCKEIEVYKITGEYVATYATETEAANSLDKVHRSNIFKVLNGERKSAGGYFFKLKRRYTPNEIT